MLELELLAPMLHEYVIWISTNPEINRRWPLFEATKLSIPYHDELVSLIPDARVGPSMLEYPEIADHLRQAIDEVFYGVKEPKQALDNAAAKFVLILRWQ